MPANRPRGTPGLLLLIFSCALLLSAAGAWEWRREGRAATQVLLASGVGDGAHYTSLSENDFHRPALVFSRAPEGLFRRTVNPVRRDDSKMIRVEMERSGRFNVYTDARPKAGPKNATAPRWYLKAAENRYVEFGERKYHPNFEAPKP